MITDTVVSGSGVLSFSDTVIPSLITTQTTQPGQLTYRTGDSLSLRGGDVLRHHLRGPVGTGDARIHQEAFGADPISGQVQVDNAWHLRPRSAGKAAFSNGGECAGSLDAWHELSFYQHITPARLRCVQQVFEVTLVLARVSWMPRIQLLEGDDEGRAFRGDARVDRLGTHEPRAVQVLHHRTLRDRQAAKG